MLLPPLLLACAGFAPPESGANARFLTPELLGPVRIGASVEEAAGALGVPLRPRAADQSPHCWITGRADGRDPGVAYLVVDGQIRRIDVFAATGAAAPVVTAAGIGPGTPEAAVRRVYGPQGRVMPHPYTGADGGRYLIINAPGGRSGMVFETFGGRVTQMRAGLRPELDYVEGCS